MTEETRRELHAWEKCMRLTTAKVARRSVRLSDCVSLFCLVCRKIVRASDGRRCSAFSRLCMHAMSNIVVGIAVFPLCPTDADGSAAVVCNFISAFPIQPRPLVPMPPSPSQIFFLLLGAGSESKIDPLRRFQHRSQRWRIRPAEF